MIKELSNKYIYDDFVYKTRLTDLEQQVLNMLMDKETIVSIAMKCCISDRNVSRVVKDIKEKYANYKEMELSKLKVFIDK